MKIVRVETFVEHLPLVRPYTIAFKRVDHVALHFVQLTTSTSLLGLGSAAPTDITGETSEACAQALEDFGQDFLVGQDPSRLAALTRGLRHHMPHTPAARAALDMALYDLAAQAARVSVVDLLGRRHKSLPTSITIGILPLDETLDEADEYIGHGFRTLKVKIGQNLDHDLERLAALRERVGPYIRLRVDANQGYSLRETRVLADRASALDLELIEQPVPANDITALRRLPEDHVSLMAADESLHTEADALYLSKSPPCGIFNIKLMKCGGISSGLAIADLAHWGNIDCMWGCMDESVISITAALHAAYASPATHYLDLDGSLDLARDVATGGFHLSGGKMEILDAPGLGVCLL